MTSTTQLSRELDERLDGLPSVPPEHYLSAGRSAHRNRRRRRLGVAAGTVVAGVLVVTQLPYGGDGTTAREHAPSTVAGQGTAAPSLSTLLVEPGLGEIDSFSTDDIPEWAQEYGNHGPASIAPDGRLWIAPEVTVVRSIAEPFGAAGRAAGVTHSYAVEVRGWQHPDWDLEQDDLVWWFGYQDDDGPGTGGTMDEPDRWTSDLALWVDDQVESTLGRPTFAERLVRFQDDQSEVLVAGAGVEIVRQVAGVDTGDREQHPRQAAAEVVVGGRTYFVLASGPEPEDFSDFDGDAQQRAALEAGDDPYYEAFEPAVSAPDFDGFLQYVAHGMVPQGSAS